MFISTAFAQAADGAAGAPSAFGGLLPLIIIFVIFYFLLIRPQNKRMKEHKAMIMAVQRGDTVVTQGGIIGKCTKVAEEEVTVEIAEGVKVKIVKSTLGDVRVKGTAKEGEK